jgi:hypothetical protein
MLRKLSVGLAIGIPFAIVSSLPLPVQAQQVVQIPCSSLPGAGSFSNPLAIGVVTRPVRITNCSRLSSGRGFSSRFFSFTLRSTGSQGSFVASGANLVPGAISAVHPNVSTTGGFRVRTTLANGSWIGNPDQLGLVWRLLPLVNLPANPYVLGVEKIDSPLRSALTPNFDLVINP